VEGSAVLVTGAASGIGRASALAFLAAGARVAALDVDAARLAELPGEMVHLEADVRRPDEVERAIASAVAALGRLDVAHNNAGVPGPYQPLWEYSEEDFARVLEVDLVGVWRCLKHEARQMIAQGAGCIVNTTSMLARAGMAQNGAYTAAKHGVEGLTRSAALELAPYGVRVNAVAPGVTRTGMTSAVSGELLAQVPLGRIAAPEEIAAAVVWVASAPASYMTGSTVVVDGGYLAR
jgi:NAD(P)-dependent dehydrogenase (short-subunit alcohol dehydrogenase family)